MCVGPGTSPAGHRATLTVWCTPSVVWMCQGPLLAERCLHKGESALSNHAYSHTQRKALAYLAQKEEGKVRDSNFWGTAIWILYYFMP